LYLKLTSIFFYVNIYLHYRLSLLGRISLVCMCIQKTGIDYISIPVFLYVFLHKSLDLSNCSFALIDSSFSFKSISTKRKISSEFVISVPPLRPLVKTSLRYAKRLFVFYNISHLFFKLIFSFSSLYYSSLLSNAYRIQLIIKAFILILFSCAILAISSYISGVTLIGILTFTFFGFSILNFLFPCNILTSSAYIYINIIQKSVKKYCHFLASYYIISLDNKRR